VQNHLKNNIIFKGDIIMAMTAVLKVDPRIVIDKASNMQTIGGNLARTMDDIKTKVQSLQKDWESDGATTFLTNFSKLHKDIDEMLNISKEYASDLNSIAQTYISAEDKVKQEAAALPTDVFGV